MTAPRPWQVWSLASRDPDRWMVVDEGAEGPATRRAEQMAAAAARHGMPFASTVYVALPPGHEPGPEHLPSPEPTAETPSEPEDLDVTALVKALIDQVDGDVIAVGGREWHVDGDDPDPTILLIGEVVDPGTKPAAYAVRLTATVGPLP